LATFSYSFRQQDENEFIFVDELLVLVVVDEKKTLVYITRHAAMSGQ